MTDVLLAGASGMLGTSIAGALLADPAVTLRLLVRDPRPADAAKRQALESFAARGAQLVAGSLSDPASLDPAVDGAQVIVSAVQGGADVIIDGQVALAQAASRRGARRFIPSDFALDLFAAPPQAPTLALRRDAADKLQAAGIEIVHVLNGGFMDLMLARGPGMIDLDSPQARYWGTGDEQFDLTTVGDTARFTARLAADDTAAGGIYQISGARTSMNAIADGIQRRTGRPVPRRQLGTLADLRRRLDAAGDPWAHVMDWYTLALFSTPPFQDTVNDRYPDLHLTDLDSYLDHALRPAPKHRQAPGPA